MYEVLVSEEDEAKRVFIVHYYHTLRDYERDLLHFISQ